ncbi:hypothetical protein Bpfe_006494 [Biomphalaria pfeifferi]|uniref:BACK domain-containing protein n=1 Tax=Biomphalaria pfeifferi TaxID=112525 RepID=A0AAD8FIF2_BIOPF|nr:hypothetical protein Bpfe_006494 [Biomphalaria pfeifferi]
MPEVSEVFEPTEPKVGDNCTITSVRSRGQQSWHRRVESGHRRHSGHRSKYRGSSLETTSTLRRPEVGEDNSRSSTEITESWLDCNENHFKQRRNAPESKCMDYPSMNFHSAQCDQHQDGWWTDGQPTRNQITQGSQFMMQEPVLPYANSSSCGDFYMNVPFLRCPPVDMQEEQLVLNSCQIDILLSLAATYASNTAMVDSCKFALLSCDYRTIITNYLIAAKFELYDVMDRLLDQIRANFICISRTKEFLSLPADVVMMFLQDNNLNVDNELEIFFAAINWIDYNKMQRLSDAGKLLNCVRYVYINPIDIITYVEPNLQLFTGPEGVEAILNMYRYRALILSGTIPPPPNVVAFCPSPDGQPSISPLFAAQVQDQPTLSPSPLASPSALVSPGGIASPGGVTVPLPRYNVPKPLYMQQPPQVVPQDPSFTCVPDWYPMSTIAPTPQNCPYTCVPDGYAQYPPMPMQANQDNQQMVGLQPKKKQAKGASDIQIKDDTSKDELKTQTKEKSQSKSPKKAKQKSDSFKDLFSGIKKPIPEKQKQKPANAVSGSEMEDIDKDDSEKDAASTDKATNMKVQAMSSGSKENLSDSDKDLGKKNILKTAGDEICVKTNTDVSSDDNQKTTPMPKSKSKEKIKDSKQVSSSADLQKPQVGKSKHKKKKKAPLEESTPENVTTEATQKKDSFTKPAPEVKEKTQKHKTVSPDTGTGGHALESKGSKHKKGHSKAPSSSRSLTSLSAKRKHKTHSPVTDSSEHAHEKKESKRKKGHHSGITDSSEHALKRTGSKHKKGHQSRTMNSSEHAHEKKEIKHKKDHQSRTTDSNEQALKKKGSKFKKDHQPRTSDSNEQELDKISSKHKKDHQSKAPSRSGSVTSMSSSKSLKKTRQSRRAKPLFGTFGAFGR